MGEGGGEKKVHQERVGQGGPREKLSQPQVAGRLLSTATTSASPHNAHPYASGSVIISTLPVRKGSVGKGRDLPQSRSSWGRQEPSLGSLAPGPGPGP